MHIHPNAVHDYMAIKAIAMMSVVATIIDRNGSLRGNNHNYCINIKSLCRVLLQCYYLLPLLTKVTLLLFESIATNAALLQPYFTVPIDQFFSSVSSAREVAILRMLHLSIRFMSQNSQNLLGCFSHDCHERLPWCGSLNHLVDAANTISRRPLIDHHTYVPKV
jgi:hypothetical protein